MSTVRAETYDLMRRLGLTTVFGNPGSTEETFLQDFPDDFTYVLALQEASALAIADGYAQATRSVGFVNLHTAPGLGNALGNLVNTRMSKTPLILTTGQQTREMLLLEPWLTNVDAATFPRPHVKWSYETARAQDAPAALVRAYAMAVQPPQGPVYLSTPLGDWNETSDGPAVVRDVCRRVAADPDRLALFARRFAAAKTPALVYGADVDRADGGGAARAFAERVGCPVFAAPGSERYGFPEAHPQFAGNLPFAIQPLTDKLQGHDVVLVVGAPVFRYYPYVPGRYLPDGTALLHITDDFEEAARAPVGDSLVGDVRLALEGLLAQTPPNARPRYQRAKPATPPAPAASSPLSAADLFAAMARVRADDEVIVEESPSNLGMLHEYLPTRRPFSFFTMASGGLGFGLPGSVGVALGERHTKRERPVTAVIGDGSFQYSVQALWTAAQHRLRMTVVVPVNREYAILKAFATQEQTPGVPGLDVPGIDICGLATAYGCAGARATTADEVSDALLAAARREGPTVLAVDISHDVPSLL